MSVDHESHKKNYFLPFQGQKRILMSIIIYSVKLLPVYKRQTKHCTAQCNKHAYFVMNVVNTNRHVAATKSFVHFGHCAGMPFCVQTSFVFVFVSPALTGKTPRDHFFHCCL